MSGVNPFLVLGLSESILRSVSEKDILALAQSQYRALSRIFHPDMGGDAAIFAFITEAYESIQDDEERKEYIDDYLISRADKLTHARQELVELGKKNLEESNQASLAYENFFKKFGRGYQSNEPLPLNSRDVTLVFQDTVSNPEMYNPNEVDDVVMDAVAIQGYSILRRVNGLVSIAKLSYTGYTIDTHSPSKTALTYLGKNTKGRPAWEKFDKSLSSIAKELEDKASAHYKTDNFAEEKKIHDFADALAIEEKYVQYFFEEQKPKKTDYFLLGSHVVADMSKVNQLQVTEPNAKHTDFNQMVLEAPASPKGATIAGKEFSHSDFVPMLKSLKNNFDVDNLLVAASLNENDTLRYIVLGQIHPHLTQQAQENEGGGK